MRKMMSCLAVAALMLTLSMPSNAFARHPEIERASARCTMLGNTLNMLPTTLVATAWTPSMRSTKRTVNYVSACSISQSMGERIGNPLSSVWREWVSL